MRTLIVATMMLALACCTSTTPAPSNGNSNMTCKPDASSDCNPKYDDGTAK